MTLKCLTLPIARPMLKSASEFLNDSGRKAPVRMINKLFLFDCRIFSETIPLMCKNYLNSYFICFKNVVQKLLYYLPSRKFPVFVWLCPSRGLQLPCQPSSRTQSPKSFLWKQKMKKKLFILQIKILRPIIVRDILTINCTSGYHSKT